LDTADQADTVDFDTEALPHEAYGLARWQMVIERIRAGSEGRVA
jgi:hypothetical protein